MHKLKTSQEAVEKIFCNSSNSSIDSFGFFLNTMIIAI